MEYVCILWAIQDGGAQGLHFTKYLFLYIIMCFVFVIAGYAQLVIVDVVLSQIYYCSYLMMCE